MAVLDAIKTAWLDRERTRLGLPSRRELEEKRAIEARAQAESESRLESADVARQRAQAEAAAFPEMQKAIIEERAARTRNYDETRVPPQPTGDAYLASLSPEQLAEHVRRKKMVADATRGPEGSGGGDDPRTGWKEVSGPDGKLIGFAHPAAGFRTLEQLGMPAGSRTGQPTAGERDSLALGSVPIRAGETMRKALDAVEAAEKEDPLNPSTMTGPIAGRAGSVYRRLVDSSGPGGDFDNARDEARSLVYALSGKQINEQEQAWLDRLVPRLADKGRRQQLERYERFVGYLRKAKESGFTDPFSVARQQVDSELPSAAAAPAAAVPPATGAKTTVRTPQEAAALPSGTVFFTPDGKRRIKP